MTAHAPAHATASRLITRKATTCQCSAPSVEARIDKTTDGYRNDPRAARIQ